MKHLLLSALLLAGLASCNKGGGDPTPAPAPVGPAQPVILRAFAPTSGALVLKSVSTPSDTVRGLSLQIVSQDNGDQTTSYVYTWHGHLSEVFACIRGNLPAGTAIETVVHFSTKKGATLGSNPWYAEVRTSLTDQDFKNPQGIDYAGQGLLTVTPTGYALPFTGQFINGSLTP